MRTQVPELQPFVEKFNDRLRHQKMSESDQIDEILNEGKEKQNE
jgi:hypothetical protein